MNRPTGVTILAVLHYIGTLFAVLLGLGLIFGMGVIGSLIANQMGGDNKGGMIALMASLGVLFGIVMFFGAVISAVLGWGLWTLKNWARIVVIALCVLRAAFNSLGIFVSLIRFHPLGIVWSGFWLAVSGVIIWYLLQPHVRQAFMGAPSPMAAGA